MKMAKMFEKTFGKINLAVADGPDFEKAQKLSQKLCLPMASLLSNELVENQLFIVATATHIEIREPGLKNSKPIFVDFLDRELTCRTGGNRGRNELLAKAVGLGKSDKVGKVLRILDATAGFGSDAYILAALGGEVTMLERSPVISVLLEDGLARLRQASKLIVDRMSLINTDAAVFFQQLIAGDKRAPPVNRNYDVVYLDPIYPLTKKSALNRRKMRVLRSIVGDDFDADVLLAQALMVARRVVVKRAKGANYLNSMKPDIQFSTGASSRYDAYFSY
jgi:16S rRNA (guanine1516-N2)-methyltransferase